LATPAGTVDRRASQMAVNGYRRRTITERDGEHDCGAIVHRRLDG
jgi:hypothetical protein